MKPKTIRVIASCSDRCNVQVMDESGQIITEHQGYCPPIAGLSVGGDLIEMEIAMDTGRIVNWNPVSIEEWLSNREQEAN